MRTRSMGNVEGGTSKERVVERRESRKVEEEVVDEVEVRSEFRSGVTIHIVLPVAVEQGG